MADILFIERVVGKGIYIGILDAHIHNLMGKSQGQITRHTEVACL